jgi:methanol metabolism-related c-type cytochrome
MVLAFGLVLGTSSLCVADDAKAPATSAKAPVDQLALPENPNAPSASTSDSGKSNVQKAEDVLAKEDPTKVVQKVDPATTKASSDPAVEMQMNGMWLDKDGNPTPHFSKDGKMDWFSFSGYRRYGANCLVCHGPDAMGSSYAPALIDSLKTITYPEFLQTVAAGKKNVDNSSNLVMPSFGDNKNVQCYINDIYVYIRARSLGLLDRERPSKHEDKPPIYADQETACLGF